MSDPREAPGQVPPAPAVPLPADLAADVFAGNGDLTDDAPTIISKGVPHPARVDEALAGTLRGRSLAHFELIEPIGVGGMAAVIRARDKQLDRCVALKILPPEMAADPENVRRFHQEARAAARLDHENIARVFFCGEDQRLHFIAFEFVEGENLRVLLERRGRLPVPEAIHYLLQVATGLAHAAGRGVVHRDIKPSNIIVSAGGRAKLVDMGLARSLEPHGDNGLTQSGVTLGTFDYISPEQALEPRDADVRSDIYSLGCTFYHMLTGQPPVPEGTAAKKLHHHQHVAPIDPRQLNPDIPDDVAAILARMMAKDPADRYQRPEHLVQHLIQVAQRLGAVSEAPDGVLFVDAPLPSPPRKRPALMAGLAVLALAALVGVLSLAPTDPERARGTEGKRPVADKVAVVKDGGKPQNTEPVKAHPDQGSVPLVAHVSDIPKLVETLGGKKAVQRIVLDKDLALAPGKDFGADLPTGIQIQAKEKLTIEAVGEPRTITITYSSPGRDMSPWAAFTIAGGEVKLRNLHFLIERKADAKPGMVRTDLLLAALAVTGHGRLTLESCSFDWKDSSESEISREGPPAISVASVALDGSDGRPDLTLSQCYFAHGPSALSLVGRATVTATDCAFGRHFALFHLRGGEGEFNEKSLTLENCSAFVVDGPAFRLDGNAACKLHVNRSIFSRRAGLSGGAGGAQPDLIFQTSEPDPRVQYTGGGNVYDNLNAFWVRAGKDEGRPTIVNTLTDFRREIQNAGRGQDAASVVLADDVNPWVKDVPDESQPETAFQLGTQIPQLRCKGDKEMVGAQQILGKPLYALPLKPLPNVKPPVLVRKEPKIRIVDPKGSTNGGQKVYTRLGAAIDEAEPGDEIQIRSSEPLPISQIKLSKSQVNLTIKPYGTARPVLVYETPERKAAFFHLHDGQVQFEQIEFQVTPIKGDLEFQTIVEIIGSGQCTFKQCVVTLVEAREMAPERRPSVVRLTNPGEAMPTATPSARSRPEVRFQECFVHGQGDLVVACPSRPFDLDVDNSALVLDGSLLHVNGTTDKGPPPASGNGDRRVQEVRLKKVTTYLTEPLLNLRAKNERWLLPTAVMRSTGGLFIAADGKKPLIQIEGADSAEQMKRLISWGEGSQNAYINYETMIDSWQRFETDGWKKYEKVVDAEPRFGKSSRVEWEQPLSKLVPEDLAKIKAVDPNLDLQKYGADLKQLPRLAPAEPREAEAAEEK